MITASYTVENHCFDLLSNNIPNVKCTTLKKES